MSGPRARIHDDALSSAMAGGYAGTATAGAVPLVQPARLELALLDPQLRRDLGIVSAHLLDEPLSVGAPIEKRKGRSPGPSFAEVSGSQHSAGGECWTDSVSLNPGVGVAAATPTRLRLWTNGMEGEAVELPLHLPASVSRPRLAC